MGATYIRIVLINCENKKKVLMQIKEIAERLFVELAEQSDLYKADIEWVIVRDKLSADINRFFL